VLFLVRANPDITTNALAARLRITVSTVSGLVDKLVRADLIERRSDPGDRRVIPLRLTEEGQAVAGEIGEKGAHLMESIAEALSQDLESVTECLEQVVEAARKAGLGENGQGEAAETSEVAP
jgi:DNA-binding MarR family transcriptional regulator